MKPLIGINMDIEAGPPAKASVQNLYIQAVQSAGGIALAIPPMPDKDLKELVSRLDGLVLIGGRDYSPERYGESACVKVQPIDPTREDFDFRLIKMALDESNLPILGICGGLQLLNIALGGSLIQDIRTDLPDSSVQHSVPDGKENKDYPEGFIRHKVNIWQNTLLSKIYSEQSLAVPTSHHQSIKKLGNGLIASASADDDIIEAVESQDRAFTVGVQWHPERDYAHNRPLFEQFIKSCTSDKSAKTMAQAKP